MADLLAPNVGNYQIGKANVYFTKEGTGKSRRHVGNVPEASFQITADKLDHFSSMAGIRKKDFSATISVTGTLNLTLEEINAANLIIALLGDEAEEDTSTGGTGLLTFRIGAVESWTGRVEIVGSNDVGPKWTYDFPAVTFTPSDAINFIGEDFSTLPLEGDVLVTDIDGTSAFGTAALQGT